MVVLQPPRHFPRMELVSCFCPLEGNDSVMGVSFQNEATTDYESSTLSSNFEVDGEIIQSNR